MSDDNGVMRLTPKGYAWLRLTDALNISASDGGRDVAERCSARISALAESLAEMNHPWSQPAKLRLLP